LDSECGLILTLILKDIDFEVISATENSNKFQKNQVLEGKCS
jgi:hypothetical protein